MKTVALSILILTLALLSQESSARAYKKRELEKRGVISSGLGAVGTGLGLLGSGLWAGTKGLAEGIGTGFSLAGSGIKAGTHALNQGLDITANAIDQAAAGAGSAGHALISGASKLGEGITQGAKNVGDLAQSQIVDASDALREGLTNPLHTTKAPWRWFGK